MPQPTARHPIGPPQTDDVHTMPHASSLSPQPTHTSLPSLLRIASVTVATPNIEQFVHAYDAGLGYTLRESGHLPASVAHSWGRPAMAGRRYALLSSTAAPDIYIRAVEITAAPNYQPLLTFGWNAFEIIVDDVHAVRRALEDGPFTIIGEPRPLGFRPSIHAMQVRGPGQEVLYLTTETGDRSRSPLPPPGGHIGRPFIVVLGGPDILALRDFYADTFALQPNPIRASRGQTVQGAWGGTVSGTHPITLVRFREHGNSIEFNGYVKPGLGPRPHAPGELPPGNALVSFSVPDLDRIPAAFIAPPIRGEGRAYGNNRCAAITGPAGELFELIEDARRSPA